MVQSLQGVLSTKKNMLPPRGIKEETIKATLEEKDEREDIPPPIKTK